MTVGILKEPDKENRVSLLPENVMQLKQENISVLIEQGAGVRAFANDDAYVEAGAQIAGREKIISTADLVLSIHAPAENELSLFKKDALLLGIYDPLFHVPLLRQMAKAGIIVFSIDNIPRTTRAQSMDVRSSQANIAGYKAVLLAASVYCRYFPMFMTAAGSIRPAKVLVLGAGVAGLQAIATARRLGAVVQVFDTRPAVKEEVMSLGAKFMEIEGAADASQAGGYAVEQSEDYKQKQEQKIAETIADSDIVITTAQIPGKRAPLLITKDMLMNMRAGSVIIDLASSTGGNTELTEDMKTIHFRGITITGHSNLASEMPSDASKLYGKNILNFLKLIIDKEGQINLNFEDELVAGTCITHNGEIVNERVKKFLEKW